MNGVLSLEKQVREQLAQVLSQKDVIISSFSKQIFDYQQQITQLTQLLQNAHTLPAGVDEHNLQDLIKQNFVSNVQDKFHILIDVSTLIRQNINHLKIDSKAQIIKELSTDAQLAYKELALAFEKAMQENNSLRKFIEQKDEQNQAKINSLTNQIKRSKEQYSQAAQQLLQKIRILQQQNQMMYLQGKETETQRPSHQSKAKYQQLLKQLKDNDKNMYKLAQENKALTETRQQLIAKTQQLTRLLNQSQEQKFLLTKKHEQLQQVNQIIPLEKNSLKIDFNQLERPKIVLDLQSKLKAMEIKCQQISRQKDKACQDFLRLKQQNSSLVQKNQLLNKLLSNFSVQAHSQHKVQSEDELFLQQLQSKIKNLSQNDQIIISKIQQNANKRLSIQISVSKIKRRPLKQTESVLFTSPAQKDTVFPIASTPSEQKVKIRSKQGSKKMIRIGY